MDRSPGEELPRELRGKLSRGRIYRGSAWKTHPGESLPGKTGSDDLTLYWIL